jgi:hypothetical protein
LPTGALSISGTGTVQLAANTGLAQVTSLSISPAAVLDITNNHLIIDYGSGSDPISSIRGYLFSGYNGGTWTGPGIDSSVAALPADNSYGIGYADGADGVVAGLSSGQIEVAYTLYGDANLDGVVSGDDFTILVANLGHQVSGWDQGDFLYTGSVTGDDFTALVANLGKADNGADVVLSARDYAAIDAFAAANGLMADVPEPATGSLLLISGASFLMGRRQRRSS